MAQSKTAEEKKFEPLEYLMDLKQKLAQRIFESIDTSELSARYSGNLDKEIISIVNSELFDLSEKIEAYKNEEVEKVKEDLKYVIKAIETSIYERALTLGEVENIKSIKIKHLSVDGGGAGA